MPLTFEEFLVGVEQIPIPKDNEAREVLWLRPHIVGVGADKRGSRELFICGPQLKARLSAVQRRLEHQTWEGKNIKSFEANRVVLPPAEHFRAVAALIGFEFARALGANVAASELQRTFSEVEPLIEMALRRSQLSEENVLGLMGELILLEEMLRSVSPESGMQSLVLDMWRGHQNSSRDFCLGGVGIEVKTTGTETSTHYIHGLAQIEPTLESDVPEQQLYLFSVGLTRSDAGSWSIPIVVKRILGLLGGGGAASRTQLQLRFLANLRAYGGESAAGYDHDTMEHMPAYSTRFATIFEPRLYDACDPAFRVIRRAALQDTFVAPDAISYKVILPPHVTPFNPPKRWSERVANIVKTATGSK